MRQSNFGLFAKTEVWDRRGILRHYYDINKQSNEIVISVFISSKKKIPYSLWGLDGEMGKVSYSVSI